MITHEISLCIGVNKHDKVVSVKCHDTGVNLRVHLFAHRRKTWRTEEVPYVIPADATAVLKIAKPDKTKVLIDGEVQGGSIFFAHRPETFTAAGVSQAEVSLYDIAGRRLTTASFEIDVTKECICDCEKESEPYVDIMAKQIGAAIDAEQEAGEHAVAADAASIRAAEAAKKAAEAAEKAREEAERAGAAPDAKNVSYAPQTLTEAEQAQARKNINAPATGDIPEMDIVESGEGYRIHITDANGTKSAYVKNGKSDLLVAKPKETTFEEIYAARNENKLICVIRQTHPPLWVRGVTTEQGTRGIINFSNGPSTIQVKEAVESYSTPSDIRIAGQFMKCTSNEVTPGDYIIHGRVNFQGDGGWTEDGIYILPVNDTTNPGVGVDPSNGRRYKYKVRLSPRFGVQLIYSSVSDGAEEGVLAGIPKQSNLPRKLPYYGDVDLKIAKVNGALYIKAWETATTEPDWQCVYEDATLDSVAEDGTRYENGFEFHYTAKDFKGTTDLKDLKFGSLAGIPYEWADMLSSIDENFSDKNGLLLFENPSTMTYEDGHLCMRSTTGSITTKEWISGDYTAQIDFTLSGKSADTALVDRDEGLYIFPLYGSTNKNIEIRYGKPCMYRIRLSATHGASLHYGTNYAGDYGDTLAGMQDTTNIGVHTLPSTLELETRYTVKVQKKGDGLFLKVWKSGTSEPGWQCEYHDKSIGDSVEVAAIDKEHLLDRWTFHVGFINKGNDAECTVQSNMSICGLRSSFWEDSLSSETIARSYYTIIGYDWGDYTHIASGLIPVSNGYGGVTWKNPASITTEQIESYS